ncbi:indoleacetamide hydrolase [Limnohabitans sp. Jir72]|uniref:indoleacetamide hydrolase n=1 Tax=Limnohabitans sp. Jir72 TaxID=1977909 RepID=UPI00269E97BF
MTTSTSRRNFFKNTGAVSAAAMLGGVGAGLTACGGDSSSTPEDPLLALTATQVVANIKNGTLKAEIYMTAMIARAKAASGLNAMIFLNEAEALKAAKAIDADKAAGKTLGALAGLPIVVKDNINTKDMKTTGGTPSLRNHQPTTNAPSLQKLIDAGAIVLGKSNLHEWAFGITSTNFTLGTDQSGAAARPCKNPYDNSRIPGGSSGGNGVAIAARFAPAGLGTDTGGSTRVPASFCGIAGFRPSVGDGVGKGRRYPDTATDALPISTTRDTVGPMARTVADIALLDAVITGGAVPTAKALKGLKVGIPAAFWAGLDDSVKPVADAAKKKLADAGVVFVDADLTGIMALNDSMSFPIALHEPVAAIPAYLTANNAPVTTVAQVQAGLASPDVAGAFGAIAGDVFADPYAAAMVPLTGGRAQLQKLYKDYFAAQGVECVLFPTTILAAPRIDAANGSKNLSYTVGGVEQKDKDTFGTCIRNTDPCTNAGIPSLSIPAGLTAGGLPVGMQIDGPLGSDTNLLAIGMGMEAQWGSVKAPAV